MNDIRPLRHSARRRTTLPVALPAALPAAALAAACCLTALTAAPAVAAAAAPAVAPASGGGQGSSGSAADTSQTAVDRTLLAEPGVHVLPRSGAPELPSGLSALSWTVSDARTGQVLAAKDAHRQLPPASTLKTLFADTVLPRFPGDLKHKVKDSDLAGLGDGSSLVGVQPGQTYTVADLWRGVFLASGNDAVHVLANMNGSVAKTVAEMQAKARMLGADDTHVVTPDGYDEPGQVSSAYDLAVFARAGLDNPDFAQYASTKDSEFPGGYDAHGSYVASFGIENTNRLLTGEKGVTAYPGLVGVKNGYTTNAGNTLVAAARKNGRTIIVSVMNPQSGATNAVYTEATKLLDWGFSAADHTTSVGTLNAAAPERPADAGTAPDSARAGRGAAQAPEEAHAAPVASRSAVASPTAWAVGGALVLLAAASVVVLRRRAAAKNR
ncbi:D-alanyl-D-alanine carboxypeptidase [Streptomyces sp. NBC_00669]|uniref:D-alanyl-D-alanine carboxypeptidase family protein n=1 Tax=unclassified Streptomyces TaxID=2593676 RepID=UPI002E358BAF|nr:D-alanyl-D-alanine carboxypeptidase [Streptomyces sp. NBC_00669]